MARGIRRTLALLRSARDPDGAGELLSMVMESTGLAWWDQDFATGQIRRSPTWAWQLGYDPRDLEGSLDVWRGLLHPEDLEPALAVARRHELGQTPHFEVEHRMRAKDGSWRWILNWGRIVARDGAGRPLRAVGTHLDITRRKLAELALSETGGKLAQALVEIRTLQGIIPICMHCKKVRNDRGLWLQIERYVREHSRADFSHGVCPECAEDIRSQWLGDKKPKGLT